MSTTISGTVRGMAGRANPAFAVVAVVVPVAALVYAVTMGSVVVHTYVHVMAGVLWTGIDLFMAVVLGPVIGSLSVDERASFFERFTPKMSFLLPTLAIVTIAGGITLVSRVATFQAADVWLALFSAGATWPALLLIGWQFDAFRDWRWLAVAGVSFVGIGAWLAVTLPEFTMTSPLIAAALAIVTVLSVVGFGVLMPGEVRIYREMVSERPDRDLIGTVGMRNAKLSAVQGAGQLVIIVVMVLMRWGLY